jgi:hypothetical protein
MNGERRSLGVVIASIVLFAACGGKTESLGSTGGPSSGGASSSSSSSSGGKPAFDCNAKSACPGDAQGDTAACEAEMAGSCGAEYRAFGDCALAKQVCTASGTTDPQRLLEDCRAALDAYMKCKQGPRPPG